MPTSKETIKLSKNGTEAEINRSNMQLFSLMRHGIDVMWKGGAPDALRPNNGWQNSEIVMFPIVGDSVDGNICIGGTNLPMAKHGIARGLKWEVSDWTSSSVSMLQTYKEWDEVDKTNGGYSLFPRSYQLNKSYSIDGEGKLRFTLEVENKSERTMPYAIGWHPAFITQKDPSFMGTPGIIIGNHRQSDKRYHSISLSDVRCSEGNVVLLQNANSISYLNSSFVLTLNHDLGWGTQVWDKGEGLVALEPISATSLRRMDNDEPKDLLLMRQFRKLEQGKKESFNVVIKIEQFNGWIAP